MGIQGLLPLLKSIQKPTHLRNFAGQTLGVDAYGWLHRGVFACALELAQDKPTRKYVDFAMNRVRMLMHFGVIPYLVFDGDNLPSKSHTEKERAERRKESKRLGLDLLRAGKTSQAHLELQKSIDVTHLMARELIEELKHAGVAYVVAPYEADSQLAYLEKHGIISGIISEDSDLLVFGAKCLITKLDQYGDCIRIRRMDFTSCLEVSLVNWSDKQFRTMAILSGCDYLARMENMGLKTAYRLLRKHKTIEQVVRNLLFDGKQKVPTGYLEAFVQAERTFLHQWVFCPNAKELVNLNSLPSGLTADSLPYIGPSMIPDIARGVAAGDLDPSTKEPLNFVRRTVAMAKVQVAQTPDLKNVKPISEFFKPKRTPLAELDPNSFTPSPSQQHLLETQRNASWSASQASGRGTPFASVGLGGAMQSSASRAMRQVHPTQSRDDDETQGAKKMRLCSDGELASAMKGRVGLESVNSRYFAKQPALTSPLLRKQHGKKAIDNFELYSDDSITEALQESADVTEELVVAGSQSVVPPVSPRKRKRLDVFVDPRTEPEKVEMKGTETQTQSSISDLSQSHSGAETPATSIDADSRESSFSKANTHDFGLITAKWAHPQGQKSRGPERRSSVAFFSHQYSPGSREADVAPARTQQAPTFDASEKSPEFIGDLEEAVVPMSSPICTADFDPGPERSSVTSRTACSREPTKQESIEAGLMKGSEDLLIPQSPCSSEEEGGGRPRMDYSRFTFAG